MAAISLRGRKLRSRLRNVYQRLSTMIAAASKRANVMNENAIELEQTEEMITDAVSDEALEVAASARREKLLSASLFTLFTVDFADRFDLLEQHLQAIVTDLSLLKSLDRRSYVREESRPVRRAPYKLPDATKAALAVLVILLVIALKWAVYRQT